MPNNISDYQKLAIRETQFLLDRGYVVKAPGQYPGKFFLHSPHNDKDFWPLYDKTQEQRMAVVILVAEMERERLSKDSGSGVTSRAVMG